MRSLLARRTGPPLFVGVVHLAALPGAPLYGGEMEYMLARALEDARTLVRGGVDALLIENYGDRPFFPGPVPSETVAALARAFEAVRRVSGNRPLGVNVLRNDARSALGLCAACGLSFLRVNVHVGAMLTDQGLIEGRAAETLRERARLCPDVALLADVAVKHARPLAPRPLIDEARDAALRGLADALVLTGPCTGAPPQRAELEQVREAHVGAALLIGSGLCELNAEELLPLSDGAIVGTALERDARTAAPVELERVLRLRALFDSVPR
jgi:membrane complex biogenesis BtpA family protein